MKKQLILITMLFSSLNGLTFSDAMEFSPTLSGISGLVIRVYKPEIYLNSLQAKKIESPEKEEKYLKYLEQMNLNEKVELYTSPLVNGMIAMAVDSKKIILISDAFSNLPEKAQEFVICHEASHLKSKDVSYLFSSLIILPFIIKYGIKLIDKQIQKVDGKNENKYLEQAVEGLKKTSEYISNSGLMKYVLSIVLFNKYSQKLEKKSDLEAAKAIGNIEGGIEFLELLQKQNLEKKPSMEFLIDKDGNFLLDFGHPSLTERTKYLKELETSKGL